MWSVRVYAYLQQILTSLYYVFFVPFELSVIEYSIEKVCQPNSIEATK